MDTINRSALIVKPTQLFLDWLHEVDPTSTHLTLEDLQREPTIYLVPECDSQDQAIEYLGESVGEIFEEHLDGWYRVPAVGLRTEICGHSNAGLSLVFTP